MPFASQVIPSYTFAHLEDLRPNALDPLRSKQDCQYDTLLRQPTQFLARALASVASLVRVAKPALRHALECTTIGEVDRLGGIVHGHVPEEEGVVAVV